MPAPKNNTNAKKFKTSKERKKLCSLWCNHLEKGFSKESFPYCDPQTLHYYLKNYPVDFDTDRILQAERKGRLFWEKIGMKGMMGEVKNFKSRVWEFNMKNRYQWRDSLRNGEDDKEFIINFGGSRSPFIQPVD